MGVEGEDGDAGAVDAEVFDEGAVEGNDLIGDGLGGDFACYSREGVVDGDEGNAQVFATHYHHGVTAFAETLFEILGVAGEVEFLAVDGVFVDGSGDEYVDEAVAEVGDGAFEGCEGCLSGSLGGLAGFNLAVFADDVDDVDLIISRIVGGINLEELEFGQLHALAVVVGYFG